MFKALETISEVIGWLQIAISPTLIGLGIGAPIYYSHPSTPRLITGIAILILGIVIGAVMATKAWRKKGTVHLLSRVSATPELDNGEAELESKKGHIHH